MFKVQRVCREYLIIVGSIPNGAGTMVLWFCSFLSVHSTHFPGRSIHLVHYIFPLRQLLLVYRDRTRHE